MPVTPIRRETGMKARATLLLGLVDGRGGDRLGSGNENDVAWAGSGNDDVYGGHGADELHGGSGDDLVRGGPGDDRIWVGHGTDVGRGGYGDDVLHALAADGQPDTLHCGPGRDTAKVRQSERASTRFTRL